ncbi:ROK family protein [Mycoplasmopsis cricetuli]|uniref:ROK family protein n=1 Tax=Mycoplasmopsis cricetuli TaxID=171283 RepID=UPI00046E9AE3|nr:ROK family protein [Mycoplasmopsis cricetuli]
MKKYNLASIDIGGTNTRFALFENNQIIQKIRFKTDQENYQITLDKIVNLINEYKIDALAMCIPGPADYANGIIKNSPNLKGWHNINIKKHLLSKTNLKEIVFENDANVMALANHFYFNNNSQGVTQFFTISTGFGAGLIIKNEIFTGSSGFAQEIAHLPSSKYYTSKLHLNSYAAEHFVSGTGMQLRAKAKNLNYNSAEILKNYKQNKDCTQIVNQAIDTLARTMAISLAFVNPNLIAIGGSVAINNWWIVEKAINKLKKFVDPYHLKNLKIKKDPFADDSALFGLNYLIKNKIQKV